MPPKLAHAQSVPSLRRAPGSLPSIRQGALVDVEGRMTGAGEGGGEGTSRYERLESLRKQRSIRSCAQALVAVAVGGNAEISGSPDDIEEAAQQLEKAAAEARLRCAHARGARYAPLPPPEGVTTEELQLAAALAAEAFAATGPSCGATSAAATTSTSATCTVLQAARMEADLAAARRTLDARAAEVSRLKQQIADAQALAEEQARTWAAETLKAREEASAAKRALEQTTKVRAASAGNVEPAFKAEESQLAQQEDAAAACRSHAVKAGAQQLVAEVTREVAAEPAAAVAAACKSFLGRQEGGRGDRTSFLTLYDHASVAQQRTNDDEPWADDEEEELEGGNLPGWAPKKAEPPRGKFVGGSSGSGDLTLYDKGSEDGAARREERLARLRQLEEMQRKAEEAQRLAMEELEQHEKQAASGQLASTEHEEGAAPAGSASGRRGSMLRRLSTGARASLFGKTSAQCGTTAAPSSDGASALRTTTCSESNTGTVLAASAVSSASAASAASNPSEEPPAWVALLAQYCEQLEQIEIWLQAAPTEEELADGSAMEKAMTLIAARDELNGKIQQLEAIKQVHGQAVGNSRPQ